MTEQYPKAARALVELSGGESVEITPFVGKHFILDDVVPDAIAELMAVARRVSSDMAGSADESGGVPLSAIPFEVLLREARKPLVALMRAAVERPNEWWAERELTDFAAICAAIFQVNFALYGKKMTAIVGGLLGATSETPKP